MLVLAPPVLAAPASAPALAPALEPVSWQEAWDPAGLPPCEQDPALTDPRAREPLAAAITQSLAYLRTPAARKAYEPHGGEAFRRRLEAGLLRLQDLLDRQVSRTELMDVLQREFQPYRMKGASGTGEVHITGYFEGFAEARRKRGGAFQWPLYARPADLSRWERPHPTRRELEGPDGRPGPRSPLRGLELFWLKDRLEAYLIQVQGSARLRLEDGRITSVGVGGRTDHPYVSIGQELESDLQKRNLRPPQGANAWFREHPESLDTYIPRNPRFVFFTETHDSPTRGALAIPVTGGRSLAADHRLFPPGALVLVHAQIPSDPADPTPPRPWTSRLLLDQDVGGAIQGPGRLDLFMGGGPEGRALAGGVNGPGRAYYLLPKVP